MLQSVLSVIAGFAGMAATVMIGSVVLMIAMAPGSLAAMRMRQTTAVLRQPTARYLLANILLSIDAAILGGWLTARLAPIPAETHVEALCVVVLIMGVVSALTTPKGSQPLWYRAAIPLVGVAGVAIGGFLIS